MELFVTYRLIGTLAGAMIGWHIGRPLGYMTALGGAILGAPVGLGYSWLHGRFLLWLAGTNRPSTDERPQTDTWGARHACCQGLARRRNLEKGRPERDGMEAVAVLLSGSTG